MNRGVPGFVQERGQERVRDRGQLSGGCASSKQSPVMSPALSPDFQRTGDAFEVENPLEESVDGGPLLRVSPVSPVSAGRSLCVHGGRSLSFQSPCRRINESRRFGHRARERLLGPGVLVQEAGFLADRYWLRIVE